APAESPPNRTFAGLPSPKDVSFESPLQCAGRISAEPHLCRIAFSEWTFRPNLRRSAPAESPPPCIPPEPVRLPGYSYLKNIDEISL
ncbi:hypothetical protein, partial [Alistipes finegoldii]|uniref:hypothetical protein n=1 Tax=Alistipes finegoldii TaxID=214856 RepID=UPI0024B20474